MLYFFIFIAFIAMIGVTILGIFQFSSKIEKGICIGIVLVLLVSIFVGFPIYKKATAEAEISNIEISEIYKTSKNEYYVKLNENAEPLKVNVNEVFKGDSNYLIRTHFPNMSKMHEFLFEEEKTQYVLVVTDLNIPVLSAMD